MRNTILPAPSAPARLAAATRGAAPHLTTFVEAVESRRLFAVGGSIELVGTHVEATGTDYTIVDETPVGGGDDVMRIERVGFDDVRVTVNNLSRTFDMDDVDSYALRGLSGPDQITKVGDIRGKVLLDGGAARDDVLTGTNATFTGASSIRDPSGREVAIWVDDNQWLGIRETGGDRSITIRDDADGPTVRIGSSFFGEFLSNDRFYRGFIIGSLNDPAVTGNDDIRVGPTVWGGFVFAGGGNDVITLDARQRTHVDGGAGDDLVRIAGGPETRRDDGYLENLPTYDGGSGNETVELDRQGGINLDAYPRVENVTNAHGTVVGNDFDNRITARPGDTRPLNARGGGGNDTLIGGEGNDTLSGETDDDTLTGNGGDDHLDGGDGIDHLDGGAGNDTELNGENSPPPPPPPPPAGPHAFIASDGTLTANGTAAADNVSVVRTGTDDVRVTINGSAWTFDMDDFGKIRLSGLGGNDTMSAGTGVADVVMLGGAGADRLTGNELNGDFFGGDNNDIINAGGGADAIHGDGGNDTLNGGAGNDYMEGDAGDDTLTGGSGADTMLGGDGNDTFYARDSVKDTLSGNLGTDRAQRDSIDSINGIEQNIA